MPKVSVIVPCYNEEATIQQLLDALNAQTYPQYDMEVIIADGLSTDQTRQKIHEYQQAYPELSVRLVDNPRRIIPAALNQAIAVAQGEYIIRLDAHSAPNPEYVERCVTLLQDGRGDIIGGIWQIRPGGSNWIAHSIAIAAAHPLGVGDARYRLGSQAQAVDTVPFGAFHKDLISMIGLFDESLLTNEDYEFNTRLRLKGGTVWLDPSIRSEYFARSTLGGLARQYWRYGYWKAQMLRRYPNSLRWRQALPPMLSVSLFGLGILSFWLTIARWLLLVEVVIYLLALLSVGLQVTIKHRNFRLLFGTPLAIATMHLSWGTALMYGMLRPASRNK